MPGSKNRSRTKQKKNKGSIPETPADSRPGCQKDDIERPETDENSKSPAPPGSCNQGDKLHKNKNRKF